MEKRPCNPRNTSRQLNDVGIGFCLRKWFKTTRASTTGGSVCLVPVTQQSCLRLLLPFAAADPRTAEVIAKIRMVARDNEI